MGYSIVRMTASELGLLPRPEEPFSVIGRLVPLYDGQNWSFSEELLPQPGEKTYLPDVYDPAEYLDNPDKAAFLAMLDGQCVGSIRVYRRWNRNAFVEDLAVDRLHRGHGVGTMLMDAAVVWSRENGLHGVCLETQDWNLLACRFYLKYGFRLGAADRFLYDAFPETRKETALFFYLLPNSTDTAQ